MGDRDFARWFPTAQTLVIPSSVTSFDLNVCGGGTSVSVQPMDSGVPTGDPYTLWYPAVGFRLEGVACSPGEVFRIELGDAGREHVGGDPDGGHGVEDSFPWGGTDLGVNILGNGPGHGGGGSTRIYRNGVLWLVAAGAGGSGNGVRISDENVEWPVTVASAVSTPPFDPTTVPPYDGSLPFNYTDIELADPGGAATTRGAPGIGEVGYVSSTRYLNPAPPIPRDSLFMPKFGVCASGGGGGGYNPGASGGVVRFTEIEPPWDEVGAPWNENWLDAWCGNPGVSLIPEPSWNYWIGHGAPWPWLPGDLDVADRGYVGAIDTAGYARFSAPGFDTQGGWSVGRVGMTGLSP